MTVTKRDLQSLQRQFKAFEKKMEKLIAAVEKSETTKVVKKTTKRSPAKKAPAKKKTAQMLKQKS